MNAMNPIKETKTKERSNTNRNSDSNNPSSNNINTIDNSKSNNASAAVVSSLTKASFPYSSVAHSPDHRFAVVVGKNDKLQVISISAQKGLTEWRSYRVSQHFRSLDTSLHGSSSSPAVLQPQTTSAAQNNKSNSKTTYYGDLRGLFSIPPPTADPSPSSPTSLTKSTTAAGSAGTAAGSGGSANVNLLDVAWSTSFSSYTEAAFAMSEDRDALPSHQSISPNSAQRDDLFQTLLNGPMMDHPDPNAPLTSAQASIDSDSVVAAAGSNGVVVVWHAQTALLGLATFNPYVGDSSQRWNWTRTTGIQSLLFGRVDGSAHRAAQNKDSVASQAAMGQPEAILAEHTRAVNRLSFHPRKPYLLLTASQDASVKLWERKGGNRRDSDEIQSQAEQPMSSSSSMKHSRSGSGSGVLLSWFGVHQQPMLQPAVETPPPSRRVARPTAPPQPPTWHCIATFQSSRNDAVKDIQWSPFLEHAFAMTTDSGYLLVYDSRVVARPYFKVAAHSGDCTSVDWHPTRPYILATSGGRDRSVKVWDVEQGLTFASTKSDDGGSNGRTNINSNSGSIGKNTSVKISSTSSTRSQAQAIQAANIKLNALSRDSTGTLSDGDSDTERVSEGDVESSPKLDPNDPTPSSFGSVSTNSNYLTIGSGIPSSLPKAPAPLRRNLSETGNQQAKQHQSGSAGTPRSISHNRYGTQGSKERLGKPTMALNMHTLSIGSPVTKVRWRPSSLIRPNADLSEESRRALNKHDSMLAVSTGPISGTNAFEMGSISLWTVHRPFLPLSVVQGHEEGAVTDFFWLDTPPSWGRESSERDSASTDYESSIEAFELQLDDPISKPKKRVLPPATRRTSSNEPDEFKSDREVHSQEIRTQVVSRRSSLQLESFNLKPKRTRPESNFDNRSTSWMTNELQKVEVSPAVGIWQHVVSVGRDGACLLQSLARGIRPIESVPCCALAIAPLTPFSKSATGSLQIVSVYQNVPSGTRNDYLLTGLRRDIGSSRAPGVFREIASKTTNRNSVFEARKRLAVPPRSLTQVISGSTLPSLTLTSIDGFNQSQSRSLTIAPELEHFSLFAKSYKFHLDHSSPTRSSLCFHNAQVASELMYESHAQMWRIVASIVKASQFDKPYSENQSGALLPQGKPSALDFVLWPTLLNLLLERANLGDVQTCVVLCEIMAIVVTENSNVTSRIPGLELQLIREWYMSYIEILQQHGLFQVATELISTCQDPVINSLNRTSTTFHESCAFCGKALQGVTTHQDYDNAEDSKSTERPVVLAAQRACGNCRNKVGLCFLCQTPVQDLFVWCAGCGHGGHLEHAIDWFGDEFGNEYCPTGCGHKCNPTRMDPTSFAFPIWQPTADAED